MQKLELKQEEPCDSCTVAAAEIFQVYGNYCLECWQARTHTNV